MGDHIKNEFWVVSNSEMNNTSKVEKVDKKIRSFFWVMVLKLSKKVHFLQFCADLNKKSKSLKASHIYASERSR